MVATPRGARFGGPFSFLETPMRDPKTTLGGIGVILTAIGGVLFAYSKGTLTADMISGAIAALVGGVGLIFASDSKPTAS
jgi:hypothetical protein